MPHTDVSPVFSLDEAQIVLRHTPAVLTTLLAPLPHRMLEVNEGTGTWNCIQVLQHLTWCEEDDWLLRVRTIREHGLTQTFRPFDREEGSPVDSTPSA